MPANERSHWNSRPAMVAKRSISMRKLMGCLAVTGSILPSLAHAQIGIDMTSVTCAQYLAMPTERSRVFSAWMSGWANQKAGRTMVYLDAFNKNIETIH